MEAINIPLLLGAVLIFSCGFTFCFQQGKSMMKKEMESHFGDYWMNICIPIFVVSMIEFGIKTERAHIRYGAEASLRYWPVALCTLLIINCIAVLLGRRSALRTKLRERRKQEAKQKKAGSSQHEELYNFDTANQPL